MDQALWMSVAGRGDGWPPKELWGAVVAEDWSSVRREWDRWMRPQLREMDRTGRDWRAVAMTSMQMTVKWLKDAGVSSPVPSDAEAALEPDAILRAWLPWISKGIAAVKNDARLHEWEHFVEALPGSFKRWPSSTRSGRPRWLPACLRLRCSLGACWTTKGRASGSVLRDGARSYSGWTA